MRIAILGAGNGGVCIGSYLALRGMDVSIYDKFEAVLAPLKARGGAELKGVSLQGLAHFSKISTDLPDVIDGADIIMVVTPAFAHRELARLCGPSLKHGQIVILNPGRTCGAIEFYRTARQYGATDFHVAETQSLIYACRLSGPAEGTILSVKKEMELAAMPARDTDQVLAAARQLYPQFIPAQNVLETSVMNLGAIFHPAPALLNIARIEQKQPFLHYIDGISPCVANLLEEMDAERTAIAAAIGVKTLTAKEWLKAVYGEDIRPEDTLYQAVQKQTAYMKVKAASDPYVRYLSEDIPMSLVPLSSLGKVLGVPTPAIDATVTLGCFAHKRNYWESGRNLKNLGLEGMTREDLTAFVTSGVERHSQAAKQRQ